MVKASAMTKLLMCDYIIGFLAALGRRLFNVFILYVNSFKNRSHLLVLSNIQDSCVVFHIIQVPGVCINTDCAI